jgi:hypothetical protein
LADIILRVFVKQDHEVNGQWYAKWLGDADATGAGSIQPESAIADLLRQLQAKAARGPLREDRVSERVVETLFERPGVHRSESTHPLEAEGQTYRVTARIFRE